MCEINVSENNQPAINQAKVKNGINIENNEKRRNRKYSMASQCLA
jgi:hypothetical protein